jgi:hypothetical protein
MCKKCERSGGEITPMQRQQWLDQEDAWSREMIRKHGWAIQAVSAEPDERIPSFAYTIGLTELGHPELLAFGLTQRNAGSLLNGLGNRVRDGGIRRGCNRCPAPSLLDRFSARPGYV